MSAWDEKPTGVQVIVDPGAQRGGKLDPVQLHSLPAEAPVPTPVPTVVPSLVPTSAPSPTVPSPAPREQISDTIKKTSTAKADDNGGSNKSEEVKKEKKKSDNHSSSSKKPEAGLTDGHFEEKKNTQNQDQDELEDDPFDPKKPIAMRFEYAVNVYRKNHSFPGKKKDIFDDYLRYGGITVNQNNFQGRTSGADMGDLDAEDDFEAAKAGNVIVDEKDELEIDFAGVVTDFLGRWFIFAAKYVDPQYFHEAPQLIASFLRYLLIRNVCPEYKDNIKKGIEIAEKAKRELPLCKSAAYNIPGSGVRFNRSCSLLFGGELYGTFDDLYADRARVEALIGISMDSARMCVQQVLGESIESLHIRNERKCIWVTVTAIEGGGADSQEEEIEGVTYIRRVTLRDFDREDAQPFEILLESDITKYLLPGFCMQADFYELAGEQESVWYFDVASKIVPTFYPGGEEDEI